MSDRHRPRPPRTGDEVTGGADRSAVSAGLLPLGSTLTRTTTFGTELLIVGADVDQHGGSIPTNEDCAGVATAGDEGGGG